MKSETQTAAIDSLSHVTLFVEDQDAALEWYTGALGFEKRDDEPYETSDGETGRWLTVAPSGNSEVEIALVEPSPELFDEDALEDIHSQLGIDTWWTLTTGDCEATVAALAEAGVTITGEPTELPWGISAMIQDPDGNGFNLLQPTGA